MVRKNSITKILLDFLILSLMGVVLFLIYTQWNKTRTLFSNEEKPYTVYVDDIALDVTVADTQKERQKGLSGVEKIPKLSGKLFIFDTQGRHGIWMKDMLFPIDIMWFDDNLKLVHIQEHVDPDTYPTVFSPNTDARFVLETNAYLVDSLRIQLGDRLTLPPTLIPPDVRQNLQQ